jgi:hypothetical protein
MLNMLVLVVTLAGRLTTTSDYVFVMIVTLVTSAELACAHS